jgi:hypothetical protein
VTDARTNDARTLFLCVNQPVGMIRTTTKVIGW